MPTGPWLRADRRGCRRLAIPALASDLHTRSRVLTSIASSAAAESEPPTVSGGTRPATFRADIHPCAQAKIGFARMSFVSGSRDEFTKERQSNQIKGL